MDFWIVGHAALWMVGFLDFWIVGHAALWMVGWLDFWILGHAALWITYGAASRCWMVVASS